MVVEHAQAYNEVLVAKIKKMKTKAEKYRPISTYMYPNESLRENMISEG